MDGQGLTTWTDERDPSDVCRQPLLRSYPVVVLSCVVAVFLGAPTTWDQTFDRPLYLILSVGCVALWWLTWRRRAGGSGLYSAMVVLTSGFLLVKLGLMFLYATSAPVFVREMAESLIWFPALLGWSALVQRDVHSVYPRAAWFGLLSVSALGLASWAERGLDWHGILPSLLQLQLAMLAVYVAVHVYLEGSRGQAVWQRERAAVSRLAYTDLLTGLPNRVSLERALEQLTRPPQRFALLFIDLDSFKVINDTLGHAAGDELLRGVASELQVLGDGQARAFRVSGDEFAVLLPGRSSAEAEAFAKRLQVNLLQRPNAQLDIQSSLSIGISVCPDDASTPGELLRHADSAMYAVKRAGGGDVRRYLREQDAQTERVQLLARDLRMALVRGEFHLVYQPVVDLASRRTVKAEALLRWQHPRLGSVSPSEFIPVAERIGLMPQIGLWVLREACRCVVLSGQSGLKMSVNVSPGQLLRADFTRQVAQLLAETGLESGRLELELTETESLYEDGRARATLRQLRLLGVGLSIDDFGSGYSNLSRLQTLQITGVKLDRSVSGQLSAQGGEFPRTLTQAAADIAASSGVELTAEGLETERDVELAQQLGCPLGQGYALGRPVGPEEFLRRLRAEGAQVSPEVPSAKAEEGNPGGKGPQASAQHVDPLAFTLVFEAPLPTLTRRRLAAREIEDRETL